MATPWGLAPTGIVAVSIAETELEDPAFATYAFWPCWVAATATGLTTTGVVATTAFKPVSITETELSNRFVT